MRRMLSIILLVAICLVGLALTQDHSGVRAQDAPVPQTTEEPGGQPPVPPPDGGEAVDPEVGEPAVQPTEPPPPGTALFGDALPILVNARNDIELLATSELGRDRPDGWSGSLDINDPQLPIFIRLDLELLAGTLLGANTRPDGWFGAVPGTTFTIARDIRHDIELLAVTVLPEGFVLPGWSGGDPLFACNRSTQTLVRMLEIGGVFTRPIAPDNPDYCNQIEIAAVGFAENTLLSNVAPGGLFSFDPFATPPVYTINSDFAVGFLDRGAALQVGTVPNGTAITPLARSAAQFSRMMLIQGDNFLVFVNYSDTTVTQDEFEDLPDVDTLGAETYCAADWCGAG